MAQAHLSFIESSPVVEVYLPKACITFACIAKCAIDFSRKQYQFTCTYKIFMHLTNPKTHVHPTKMTFYSVTGLHWKNVRKRIAIQLTETQSTHVTNKINVKMTIYCSIK